MLLHTQIILREVLVEVLLESIEAYCVSIFMNPILVAKLLKAVICQVNIVIAISEIVVVRRGSQVAMSKHINFIFAGK